MKQPDPLCNIALLSDLHWFDDVLPTESKGLCGHPGIRNLGLDIVVKANR